MSGDQIATPLLVPSFSSRGFGAIREPGEPERSEVSSALEFFADRLTESFLVSAYDLHHGLLAAADSLEDEDWSASLLSRPEVLIIDSGGYEVRPKVDSGELLQDLREPLPWTEADYGVLLDRLPAAAVNCAAVAWDRPGESYAAQLRSAQEFLAGRRALTPIVLLKPCRGSIHDLEELEACASKLAFFGVIGITEHELGATLLDRIVGVMRLRSILDRARLSTPIHIFGALDPLFVPLYFAAGADIFDGLTWLRYAYWHGLAVHREQAPLLQSLIEQRDDVRRFAALASNLTFLGQLQSRLRRFVAESYDWTIFNDPMVGRPGEHLGDVLQSAYLSAMARRT
ncbi:hypothetical protein [Solirubrobacter deserti]|uniref:Dihydrodipicolinate synthase family protein n=1 Tax=Solirubrobacter deserti TaxID=2282478 RepID=A0ABT4REU7_9ACTN|nr:hypothetical protein [Solirubrobacter deserti]MDA0137059.1 hypothetical protein [Solirubrobacter deserti]